MQHTHAGIHTRAVHAHTHAHTLNHPLVRQYEHEVFLSTFYTLFSCLCYIPKFCFAAHIVLKIIVIVRSVQSVTFII